jgi:hypothetical protein
VQACFFLQALLDLPPCSTYFPRYYHARYEYDSFWSNLYIDVLFAALMATDARENFKFEDDLSPLILPPRVPFRPNDPVRFTIPYVNRPTSLGACCDSNNSYGFLEHISFEVLNSSAYPQVPKPYSLGDFPTSNFTFEWYSSESEMFAMLYETTKTGWLAAYVFDALDLANNR